MSLTRDLNYSQEKDEHLLAQKKMPDGKKEEISQVLIPENGPILGVVKSRKYLIFHCSLFACLV